MRLQSVSLAEAFAVDLAECQHEDESLSVSICISSDGGSGTSVELTSGEAEGQAAVRLATGQ